MTIFRFNTRHYPAYNKKAQLLRMLRFFYIESHSGAGNKPASIAKKVAEHRNANYNDFLLRKLHNHCL
jgi:hypothetical protein